MHILRSAQRKAGWWRTQSQSNQSQHRNSLRYDSHPPRNKFRSLVLSCDPAGKANIKNDHTAITVLGIDKRELYLLQVSRGHWTVLEMRDRIKALASQWEATHVIVEDTASGMGLIQILWEQTRLSVIGRHPKDDKETRLSRHQGRFEAGRIFLPAEAPWLADFESELLAFPNSRYDDQVDALLLFLDWISANEYDDSCHSLCHLSLVDLGMFQGPRFLRSKFIEGL